LRNDEKVYSKGESFDKNYILLGFFILYPEREDKTMNVRNQNDEAVSPVIGVILMVAITVILAAMVTVLVFNETDKIQPSEKSVILQGSANANQISLEIYGGADLVELTGLRFRFDNAAPTTVTANGIETDLTDDGVLSSDAVDGEGDSVFNNGVFNVGDTITLSNEKGKFTVVGIFADGTEQPLYSKALVPKTTPAGA